MKPLEPGMRYAPRVPASPHLVDREESPAAPSSPASVASVAVLTSPLLELPARLERIEAKLDALIEWIQAAEITPVEVKG